MDIKDFTDEELKFILNCGLANIMTEYRFRMSKARSQEVTLNADDCFVECKDQVGGDYDVYRIVSVTDDGLFTADVIHVNREQIYRDEEVEYDICMCDITEFERMPLESFELMSELANGYDKAVNELHDGLYKQISGLISKK